jgi:hypothetical protein
MRIRFLVHFYDHNDLTELTTSILFLLHCYGHNGTMVLLSKLRAF